MAKAEDFFGFHQIKSNRPWVPYRIDKTDESGRENQFWRALPDEFFEMRDMYKDNKAVRYPLLYAVNLEDIFRMIHIVQQTREIHTPEEWNKIIS